MDVGTLHSFIHSRNLYWPPTRFQALGNRVVEENNLLQEQDFESNGDVILLLQGSVGQASTERTSAATSLSPHPVVSDHPSCVLEATCTTRQLSHSCQDRVTSSKCLFPSLDEKAHESWQPWPCCALPKYQVSMSLNLWESMKRATAKLSLNRESSFYILFCFKYTQTQLLLWQLQPK